MVRPPKTLPPCGPPILSQQPAGSTTLRSRSSAKGEMGKHTQRESVRGNGRPPWFLFLMFFYGSGSVSSVFRLNRSTHVVLEISTKGCLPGETNIPEGRCFIQPTQDGTVASLYPPCLPGAIEWLSTILRSLMIT